MWTLIGDIIIFIGGFVASIYAWPKLRVAVNGVKEEAIALEAKAKALRDSIKLF